MGALEGYVSDPRCQRPAQHSPSPKANILINDGGQACLAGFSLLAITSDQPAAAPWAVPDHAIQWMSPELIDPSKFNLEESRPTKQSDCYALGMVIYEVLSEQVPFAPREGTAIIPKVVGGERPERPRGREGAQFTDELWRMLGDCWKPQPDDRPSLDIVLRCLQGGGKPSARPRWSGSGGWFGRLLNNALKPSKPAAGKPHGP